MYTEKAAFYQFTITKHWNVQESVLVWSQCSYLEEPNNFELTAANSHFAFHGRSLKKEEDEISVQFLNRSSLN